MNQINKLKNKIQEILERHRDELVLFEKDMKKIAFEVKEELSKNEEE